MGDNIERKLSREELAMKWEVALRPYIGSAELSDRPFSRRDYDLVIY
jgi:hypothetical protein